MKKLILIGNADVTDDHSELINDADVVVRINLRTIHNTIHNTTGTKTDMLCYTPRAVHMVMNNDQDLRLIERYCRNVSRLVFLRPRRGYLLNRLFLSGFFFRRERLFFDLSKAFVKRLNLKHCRIDYIGIDFLDSTISKLQDLDPGGKRPSPSAGIMTIEKALADEEYVNFEKYLLGFTFEGWEGHPWTSEKKLVERYGQRGLLKLIHKE